MHRFTRLSLMAMLAVAQLPGIAAAQSQPSEGTAASHPYAVHVADAARRFGIPDAWIWAVMRVESNGNVRAVSHAGAMGLMQIMPATWMSLRARHGLGRDPYNVRDNIMAGAAYLRAMYDRYGNASAMLAAYNAGPGRYDQYRRGRPLPRETRAYLAKLTSITGQPNDIRLASAHASTRPSDPHGWRRAALFPVRSESTASAHNLSSEGRADAVSDTPAATSQRPANGLFVVLSGQREQ